MSKHDLKGIDTGKIGGNKYVDYTFKDFKKDMNLTDLGTAKEIEKRGYNIQDFKPIIPTVERSDNFLSRVGIPVPTPLGIQQLKVGLPTASELELDNRGLLVGKDRPKNLAGGLAGIADIFTGQFFDFDKRGGNPFYGLTGDNVSLQGYGKEFEGDYELPTSLKETLALQEKAKKEKETKDPMGDIQEIVDETLRYKKGADTQSRKGRVLDSALEFLNYALVSPKIRQDIRDDVTFKQQQLLDAEAIKQGLADAVQARTLSAAKEASELRQATAAQQDAATRFAGLGMQRRFG